jgi:hypothetical protein
LLASGKRISPMARVRIVFVLLTGLCLCAVTHGSDREHVDRIADLIENNYFDPDRAREVASGLRVAARAGEFDRFTEPRELAGALTERLRKVDRHFTVTWSGPSRMAEESRQSGPAMSFEQLDRRNAFGFRRVEMLAGAIGYIELRSFADFDTSRADEPARKAADAALQLIADADAVIVDLRDNGGGSPAMVGYLVSAFTPPGANIYNTFRARDRTSSERPKQLYAQPRLDVPLYVLTSNRTASAAESAAYTLQAAKRAVIVGERSGGAANPGGMFPVGGGFNVFISTGTPVNPITGTNWEGTGVTPDVAVPAGEALRRAQLAALEGVLAKRASGPASVDTQWTLEALRAETAPVSVARPGDYAGAYGAASIESRNDGLFLKQGQRPPWQLIRIRDETFFAAGDPSRRVVFERDAAGKVRGFEIRFASGRSNYFGRGAPSSP